MWVTQLTQTVIYSSVFELNQNDPHIEVYSVVLMKS
jgi:hypothetical protein